jgi:hypothetical protein
MVLRSARADGETNTHATNALAKSHVLGRAA